MHLPSSLGGRGLKILEKYLLGGGGGILFWWGVVLLVVGGGGGVFTEC